MSFNSDAEKFEDGLFDFMSPDQMKKAAPYGEVIKGVLPDKGMALIVGATGAGKSFLALDMVCAIAEGAEWFGHRTRQRPVVYIALEGEYGMAKRIMAWEKHNGRPMPKGVMFVTGRRRNGEEKGFSLLYPEDRQRMIASIAYNRMPASVIIVDTLNRASVGANENDSDSMGQIINGTCEIAKAVDGLGLLIHHPGKDLSRGARGHSSLAAAVDASIEVIERDGMRLWSSTKIKDGERITDQAFSLQVIDIGTDKDGDPVTSCVIRREEAMTGKGVGRPKGKWQHAVYSIMDLNIVQKGNPGIEPQSNGHPSMLMEDVISLTLAAKDGDGGNRARELIRRAIDAMCSSGIIARSVDRVWFV